MQERQAQILEWTVRDYIDTADPVGSGSLRNRHGVSCSSATIRNELSDLTKAGYLMQPHSSSGRVPTAQGYRFYVDRIREKDGFHYEESEHIASQIQVAKGMHDTLQHAAQVLSLSVDYTTVLVSPALFQAAVKAVHLVLLDLNKILVVLLGSMGVTEEFICDIDSALSQDELTRISKAISSKTEGLPLHQLNQEVFDALSEELPHYSESLSRIQSAFYDFVSSQDREQDLSVYGSSKMLQLPEFENIGYARQVMGLLEETSLLNRVFQKALVAKGRSRVLIGEEMGEGEVGDCSVVAAPYEVDGVPVGTIGFLGPFRMRYSQLIPLVESVTSLLSEHSREVK